MTPDLQPHRDDPHWYDAPATPAQEPSSRALWIRFLLILVFGLVIFALGHAMVANHFFTGGALNNHRGQRAGP